MRSLAFGLVAWIALFPAAHAQDDIERARTYHRRTTSGTEVRILTYVQHRSGCVQGPNPLIKLTAPPAHGSIAIRPGSVPGSRSRFGAGDCSNELNGLALWYTPKRATRAATSSSTRCCSATAWRTTRPSSK